MALWAPPSEATRAFFLTAKRGTPMPGVLPSTDTSVKSLWVNFHSLSYYSSLVLGLHWGPQSCPQRHICSPSTVSHCPWMRQMSLNFASPWDKSSSESSLVLHWSSRLEDRCPSMSRPSLGHLVCYITVVTLERKSQVLCSLLLSSREVGGLAWHLLGSTWQADITGHGDCSEMGSMILRAFGNWKCVLHKHQ